MFDVTCKWIDVCDEFDENVKNKIIANLTVIAVYVIDDDVIDVTKNVIKIDVNVWFNITAENDIVKCFFRKRWIWCFVIFDN